MKREKKPTPTPGRGEGRIKSEGEASPPTPLRKERGERGGVKGEGGASPLSPLSFRRGVGGEASPSFVLLLWLLTFLFGKLAFIALCHGSEALTFGDVLSVLWHGLPMDLSMTAYLLLLPWLFCWVTSVWPGAWRWLRPVLLVFHALVSLAVSACLVGDIALYPFWGFKLDATIWTYIDSPKDAVASVSTAFVLLHLAAFLLLALALILAGAALLPTPLRKARGESEGVASPLTPLRKERGENEGVKGEGVASPLSPLSFRRGVGGEAAPSFFTFHLSFVIRHSLYALVGGLLFVLLRGGVTESTMNVGNAYFSDRQFLNHAAVNPVFSLLSSSLKVEHFDQLYRAMPAAEAARLVEEVFPGMKNGKCKMDNGQWTMDNEAGAQGGHQPEGIVHCPLSIVHSSFVIRHSSFPSLLLLFWEGCGGQLTSSLGGPACEKAITPCLDSLAHTGIFFSELRANSFRTDRGTLCTLSGHVSFPTHSLMKMAARAARLPSIARTLQKAGYSTSFMYGGDINFTNMKGYLLSTGFQRVTADVDFSRADRATAQWGVCDSVLFLRLFDELTAPSQRPRFVSALTLSSHEPWDVPASYRRPGDADEMVAAFRYTDHHLGRFIRRLRSTPLWDSLLVVILPDHGVLAAGVERREDPRFLHIPMVWTGGAVRGPQTLSVLMNQSDLPATLLAQLGLPHDDFPWSRDVLSPTYTAPLAYSTINDAFIITVPSADGTASQTTLLYDNKAQHATLRGDTTLLRPLTRIGQAILQRSYDQLNGL